MEVDINDSLDQGKRVKSIPARPTRGRDIDRLHNPRKVQADVQGEQKSRSAEADISCILYTTLITYDPYPHKAERNLMSNLYERLGRESAVDKAVDIFYRKVLSDDRVNDFFDDVDMDKQAAKQKAFLTMVFGGPNSYTGMDMREGHKHLVANGLNDSHVDAIIELLGDTLKELGAADTDIGEVAAIANSVRDDVLNR